MIFFFFQWFDEIRRHGPNTPIILLANKTDLRNDPKTINYFKREHNRDPISYDEGMEMAKILGAAAYVECSALKQTGLHEAFDMVYQVTRSHPRKLTFRKRISNFFSSKWGNYMYFYNYFI